MKIVECVQNTEEWFRARLGIPTSSAFVKIVTPGGDATKSTVSETYMMKLLAEWLSGESEEGFSSSYMDRGYLTQPEALDYYGVIKDVTVEPVGFIMRDNELAGSSTDGLAGDELNEKTGEIRKGIIEAKCPSGGVQVGFLLNDAVPRKYWPQIQGGLWVSGADFCDYISYHEKVPAGILRVERDESLISAIDFHVGGFIEKLLAQRELLEARGYSPAVLPPIEFKEAA